MRSLTLFVTALAVAACAPAVPPVAAPSPVASAAATLPPELPASPATSSEPVAAAISLEGPESVVTSEAGFQSSPAVALNTRDDTYFVTWFESREGRDDIYGQHLDQSGQPVGPRVLISAAPGSDYFPAVAYNAQDNEFLVVWQGAAASFTQVRALRLDRLGVPVGSEFALSEPGVQGLAPAVVYNQAAAGYLVAWPQSGQGDALTGLMVRRVSPRGVPTGEQRRVAAEVPDTLALALDTTSGGALLAWSTEPGGVHPESIGDILAQRLTREGATVGDRLVLSSADGVQKEPAVAYNAQADEFLVTWTDHRHREDEGSGGVVWESNPSYDIYAQRLGAEGALRGANFPVSRGPLSQVRPAVAFDAGASEYLIAWHDNRNKATSEYDLFGRRVSGAGALVGVDTALAVAPGQQYYPRLVFNAKAGESLLVWHDFRKGEPVGNAEFDVDIYARRLRLSR